MVKSQISLPAEAVLNLVNGRLRSYATFLFAEDQAFMVNDQVVVKGEKKTDWIAFLSQWTFGVSDRSSEVERERILKDVQSGECKVLKMTCMATKDQVTGKRNIFSTQVFLLNIICRVVRRPHQSRSGERSYVLNYQGHTYHTRDPSARYKQSSSCHLYLRHAWYDA